MIALMGKKSKKPSKPVRAYMDVANWVETIATAEGIGAADVISPILEENLRERYLAALRVLEAKARDALVAANSKFKRKAT